MKNIEAVQGPNKSIEFKRESLNALLAIEAPYSALEKMRAHADSEGLEQKTEFHSTIIGRETGDEITRKIEGLPAEEREGLVENLASLLNEYNWEYTPNDEFYSIHKLYEEGDERRSIIQIIEIPELEDFYAKLNEMFGTDFSVPFPHITLYTTSTRPDKKLRGIGTYSQEHFSELNPQRLD